MGSTIRQCVDSQIEPNPAIPCLVLLCVEVTRPDPFDPVYLIGGKSCAMFMKKGLSSFSTS
jgi:hypothetical protein